MGNNHSRNGGYKKYLSNSNFRPRATSAKYKAGDNFDEQGSFESTRFGPSEDGFVIGNFSIDGGETIVCKGTVPGFVLGAPYHITGKVIDDKTWGIQVNIKHAVGSKPTTEGQLEAFLGSGAVPGIGPVTAKKIVQHFGKETLKVLEEEPERLKEVPGIGDKSLKKIAEELPNQLKYRDVIGFFASLGISVRTINRLIAEYGGGAKDIVEKNPYILCRIRGFAFTRADSIAVKMGISKLDRNRLYAGVMATLRYICDSEGHTVVSEEELLAKAQEKLQVEDIEKLSRALEELLYNKRIVKDDDGYHLKHLFKAEKTIKKCLRASVGSDILLREDKVSDYLSVVEKHKGFSLTDEQAQAVKNIFKYKISILSGKAGTGKAQPLYSKVLTEHGWKSMGDLQVGDLVWTPKGTLAPITGIFPQGEKEVYRVFLADGRYTDCCSEHIWRTMKYHVKRCEGKPDYIDRTLQEMIDLGVHKYSNRYDSEGNITHVSKANRYRLPVNQAIPFEEQELPIDPYVVGAFLGDGCCTCRDLTFSCHSDDRFIVDSIAEIYGLTTDKNSENNHSWFFHNDHFSRNGLGLERVKTKEFFIELPEMMCLASDKYIPDIYKYSSIEQRWLLIQGLFDTDGSISNGKDTDGYSRYNVRFTSSSKQLAEDVVEVLRSLGVEASMTSDPDRRKGQEYQTNGATYIRKGGEYSVSVRCPNDIKHKFFRLPRKKQCGIDAAKAGEKHRHYDMIAVSDIKDMGYKTEMQCIMVDDPDHLYITDDYIVTHNTAVSSAIVEICQLAGIPVCLMSPTGRAAKHLSDTCGGSEPGYTMHRALSIQMRAAQDDDFFDEDQSKQIRTKNITEAVEHFNNAEIVIADEASMMDTEMAAILFQACKNKHLMLVGDPNQLPSVGPGRVLGDLMESSYSQVHGMLTFLTKVFRQKEGSPVINAANLISEGKNPVHVPGVKFFEVSSNEEVPEKIEKYVLPYIKERQLGYENYAFLSPIKKTPYAGVDALNSYLRPKLNPYYKKPASEKQEFLFQRGDFVMQTKNNYEVDIYNGDIGIVEAVDKDGNVEVLFSGDDDEVCYEKDEVYGDHQIIPAFAMTVHKSQGDQYDTVVVVLTSSQFPMLNRNLLYTAVTRAENELILIGDARAFAMAASNQKENKRKTGLRGI